MIMYRVILLTVVLAAVSPSSGQIQKKCYRLVHPGTMQCCKSGFTIPHFKIDGEDDLKECMEMPHDPHSCDHDICIGKKRGFVSDDGTLDKAALEKVMSEDFKDSAAIVEAVKENCIKGDLSEYGPPDMCEIMKIKHCVQNQAVNECKEWDDNGPCAGIKDLVKECAKKMDS